MSQYLNTPQNTRVTDGTEMIILSFNVIVYIKYMSIKPFT